jgi:hypothetical protein
MAILQERLVRVEIMPSLARRRDVGMSQMSPPVQRDHPSKAHIPAMATKAAPVIRSSSQNSLIDASSQ